MDKEKRSRLRNVVTQARTLIELNIRAQLRRLGINEDGSVRPLYEVQFLSRHELKLRGKILPAIYKEKAGDITPREALDRYIRHIGFTFINRVAALRAMEVRGLIKETVLKRPRYGGMSRREYEIAEKHREYPPEKLLKASLLDAFREVSEEIKVLFDVSDEYSLIFPEPRTLRDLRCLFSEKIPDEDWKEDDIIGWIYQYYNEEARAKYKKDRRAPKADDIPVINQFYTPRWVVRALVDNTLGRLWLEMNDRCLTLGAPLMRSQEQLNFPSGDTVEEFCSYLVPLRQKSPPRMKKNVREIKVLDPACGSGHFLVYAFDVLYRMYKENEPETPEKEIPNLILENNLFGIDIDLRAVQLAALSLYLKAKHYNRNLKIKKLNLVCADARITDGTIRREFLDLFSDDPDLQRIFEKLFEDLDYTYEIGSLLKVRQPFETLLSERRRAGGVQASFSLVGQMELSARGRLRGQSRFMKAKDISEMSDQPIVTPKSTLKEMLNILMNFEKEAMEKRDMGTLLFATEVEKSVGLLALLSEKYDVVLMNPAYGPMPSETKEYAKNHYPRTKNDYYAAFIEQAIDLTEKNGFVGMLTSRTFMFLKKFRKLREDILWNEAIPELLLDTGFGVLDGATVETAATVVRKSRGIILPTQIREWECTFCRLSMFDTHEKEKMFVTSLIIYLGKLKHTLWYQATLGDLAGVPRTAYAYWLSPSLRGLFKKYRPLDRDVAGKTKAEKIADVKQGLATADDKRFTRQFWEVSLQSIGRDRKWAPFAKGGQMWYSDIDLIVNWEDDGKEVKQFIIEKYPYLKGKWEWVAKNTNFYFLEGLSYPPTATGFNARILVYYLPRGCIFGHKGISIFWQKTEALWSGLAILNSELIWFLLLLLTPSRSWEAGLVASLPWVPEDPGNEVLADLSQEIYDLLYEWDTGNEISTIFIKPWVLQIVYGFNSGESPITGHPLKKEFSWSNWISLKKVRLLTGSREMSLRELAELAVKREKMIQERVNELHRKIDEEVYHLYKIGEEDKKLIKTELALRRGEISLSVEREDDEDDEDDEVEQAISVPDIQAKVKDHIARLISFYIKKTLESDPDGIVPLCELVQEIRQQLVSDFGENQVDIKEGEIEELLGKSLEEWIATEYFDFHVNLYKRRPIFWHLTSSNFARGRGIGAFNCLLHYHKLNRDTIPKIRVNYLRDEIDRAKRSVDRLRRGLQRAKDAKDKVRERRLSDEFEEAFSILEELQNFDKALEEIHNFRLRKTKLGKQPRWVDRATAEVRDDGWTPIIDYGVRVNLQPLKEAKLLHKAANKVK